MAKRAKAKAEAVAVAAPADEKKEERPRIEVEPPRRARCGHCGGERLRVAYTTVFRESGFRRVTADCQDCHAVCWWDEELRS